MGINMENWQQVAERTDPWKSIPFDDKVRMDADVIVGVACIFAAVVALLVGR